MTISSAEFDRLFGKHAALMRDICRRIHALDSVERIVLFGSYAKGCPTEESDVDLAVFFRCTEARLLERYRELARICANPQIDVQAQPFHAEESLAPCGIVEEICQYGVELQIDS